MKFIVVRAAQKRAEIADAENLRALRTAVFGENVGVDFGGVAPRISIVVYEFGLVDPPNKHRYFTIGQQLFAGDAIIFRTDEAGETIDCTISDFKLISDALSFYEDAEQVEKAILSGICQRPEMSVNGQVLWSWGRADSDA